MCNFFRVSDSRQKFWYVETVMPIDTLMITIYCQVCLALKIVVPGGNPRQRGCAPRLSDAEALTMAYVGAFLGYHGDKELWEYFRRHWAEWFPQLGDRSSLARQLANLGHVQARLHRHWAMCLGAFEAQVHLVDGFPVSVCHPARAARSTLFRGDAAWGYCASKGEYYFGFHGLVLTTAEGVITDIALTAANVDERDSIFDLALDNISGLLLGDKGFIRPSLTDDLAQIDISLQTPLRDNMHDSRPKSFVQRIVSTRRRVETVIGQLAGRFSIERTGARKLWQMVTRIYRKVAAHTLCVLINKSLARPLLDFEGLVSA